MKKIQAQNNLIFSIVIPMYNGENFINNSMHSIINTLSLDENIFNFVEILIINDGSKDNCSLRAKEWASEWNSKIRKDFIRVIDKENGQYGSVINLAIKNVNGRYMKVLDVDDIFNTEFFVQVVQIISGIRINVDLILTDFIFDKVLHNKQIIYQWNKFFEPFKILNTNEQWYPNSIITMHSIIYRTDFLREINYNQIEGVYYSDSQYSTIPFAQAKRLYYINIPLYRYYIGRSEQSININTMVKNRHHQRNVMNRIISELFNLEINSAAQKKYVWRVAKNMFEWQVMIIAHDKKIENRGKYIYKDLINILKLCKENDHFAYKVIKKGMLSRIIKLTKGHGIVPIIRFGEKLYAKFKLNVMADWD